jgi:hypothetical protein
VILTDERQLESGMMDSTITDTRRLMRLTPRKSLAYFLDVSSGAKVAKRRYEKHMLKVAARPWRYHPTIKLRYQLFWRQFRVPGTRQHAQYLRLLGRREAVERTVMRPMTSILAFRVVAPTFDRAGRDADHLAGLR